MRSITGLKMSEPYVVNLAAPPTDPQDPGDTSIPAAEATPAPTEGGVTEAGEVTLTTNEADADLFFTTDGSPVLTGDMPSDTAKLYTGPIKITEQTEINFVAIDTAGNFKLGTGVYAPEPVTVPAAPTLGSSIGGQGQVTARWNSTDTTITGYGVQLYEGTGDTTVGPLRETTEKSLVIRDLEPGTSYTFTVKAMNAAGYGPASERSAPLAVTAVTDRITISSARWKSGDFRVSGTGSAPGATLTVRRGSATGTSLGTGTVAADGTYSLRFRNGAAPATNPGTIYVTSNRGGQAGPFTVSNA